MNLYLQISYKAAALLKVVRPHVPLNYL